MPNGGSDCCGTCWFNSANEGEPGYRRAPQVEPVRWTIRDLEIDNPFYTYCANHPHHNRDRLDVPIGPVYVADGYPYTRRVFAKSPDTEDVRAGLLDLLAKIEETPPREYPSPTQLDEEVIKQLMDLREGRAAPALRRIVRFSPPAEPSGDNPFGPNRMATVALAVEALAAIEGDNSLSEVETVLRCGLSGSREVPSKARTQPKGNDERDNQMAAIRYHVVLGLKHCSSARALELLREATRDPHPEVAAFAGAILAEKEAEA